MKNFYTLLIGLIAFLVISFQAFDPKVPELVLNSFEKRFKNAKNVKWEIEEENDDDSDDKNTWEAEFKLQSKNYSACFDINGNLLETEYEITLYDIPGIILNELSKSYPNGKIKKAEHVTKHNNIYYEVEIKFNKKTYEVLFNESGDLIKSEIE